MGDDRLVARVRAGDHDAFETIYDRYYLGLLAFCRHMLGSRDEAEDALQQSFASAYRALRGGAGVVDLRPWLYAIARNRCLSALRAQRDELTVDGLDLGGRTFDGLPAEITLRAELRELVEDLQRLPDDQRAALVLFELGDQSHEHIAAVLDVRREKVKALVFQAREALLRARRARDTSCAEIRQQLASLTGEVPRRGMLRGHIDRCPACAAFEREVRRQRAAFAVILPVAPSVGLKGSVLALFGGGGAAAAGGAGIGSVGSAAAVAGSVAAGGTTIGLASLGAKGAVTKALAVVALAGGASEPKTTPERAPTHKAVHVRHHAPPPYAPPASVCTGVTATQASQVVQDPRHSKAAGKEDLKSAPAPAAKKEPQSQAAEPVAPSAPPSLPAPSAASPAPAHSSTSSSATSPPTTSPPTDTSTSSTSTPASTPTRTESAPQASTPPATEAPATTTTSTATTAPDTSSATTAAATPDSKRATATAPLPEPTATTAPGTGATAAATAVAGAAAAATA